MSLSVLDVAVFIAFLALVVGVSLYASRKEETSEDYFLAGRGLTWWLIGFSLIASNISSEHFVGMAGSGFGAMGLAVASYEWIAALTLVFVGLWLLPLYLRLGIYTIPEFLEHRYGAAPRAIMALLMIATYALVLIAAVLYSGAIVLRTLFDLELSTGVWLIGPLAAAYTIYGGLKAVVWSDLLQGIALLVGGVIVAFLGFQAVGGVDAFFTTNADKLHMVLPAEHPDIPWTALLIGIWIPNIYYWGFNQFITQRTLGARSLAAGQNGAVFAAAIKLLIPFIIVFPGIMAYQLYGDEITDKDAAYPYFVQRILPHGLRGVMFAALFGAVMSSLDSMLNSASTIFTMDLYRRHLRPDAPPKRLIAVGRITTGVLVLVGCTIAPLLADPEFGGVFNFIQQYQGFVSPGVVAVFAFGLLFRRAPTTAAVAALVLNVPIYGILLWLAPDIAFLNRMAITFALVVVAMAAITMWHPRAEPWIAPRRSDIDLTPSRGARLAGAFVAVMVVGLYVLFW